MKTNQTKLILK